jgi:hypothetical protein
MLQDDGPLQSSAAELDAQVIRDFVTNARLLQYPFNPMTTELTARATYTLRF